MKKRRPKRSYLRPGETVLNGRYEILKLIANRGMANVYLVNDRSLNKQWCLKEIYLSEAGRNNIELRSLIREANIMKGLNHPSIPRIVTMEKEGDSLFIVMDFVDGVSIQNLIDNRTKLSEKETVNLSKQIASVIGYLHNLDNPIMYRDMKPANVMVQSDGNIKLLDFGISEVVTRDNSVIREPIGTKGYAPPEQVHVGEPYDNRSDIYSLGVTMYYMITGINPALYPNRNRSITDVDNTLSKGLDIIILKATQNNPGDRYSTIEELIYDLNNYTKLDGDYKRKLKKKVNTIIACFIAAGALALGSLIPQYIDTKNKENSYENSVIVAENSGRLGDYVTAISQRVDEYDPYDGMFESIKSDGVFTPEEEVTLLGLVNPNITEIQSKEWYPQFAYEMGKLYWFYYDGAEDGLVLSNKWFQAAKDGLQEGVTEKSLAEVYYNLGLFRKDIAESIQEASDAGMYREYWNNLMLAQDDGLPEIMELEVYLTIASCIDNYSYRLMTDGVSKEDIEAEVEKINQYLDTVTPTPGRPEELYNRLEELMSKAKERLDVAASGRGGALGANTEEENSDDVDDQDVAEEINNNIAENLEYTV